MRRSIAPLIAVGLCFAMSGHAWGQVAEQATKEPRKPAEPFGGPIDEPHAGPHHGPHGPPNSGPPNGGPRFDVSKLPVGRTILRQSEREARIRASLEEPAVFELKDITLGDLVKHIQEKYKISVVLDIPALTADGYGTDTILTPQVREISLRGGLHSILDDGYTMTFVVRNDALLITTKTAAETMTSTRVYQVHDLVVAAHETDRRPDFYPLIEVITATIDPEGWREAGGTIGEIKEFEAAGVMALVVTQTEAGHEEVEKLLGSLRDAKVPPLVELQSKRQGPPPSKGQAFAVGAAGGGVQGFAFSLLAGAGQASNQQPVNQQPSQQQPVAQPVPNGPPQPPQGPHIAPQVGQPRFDLSKLPVGTMVSRQSAAEAKIRAALDAPAGFTAKETTISEFAKQLAAKHKISVVLDDEALAADGKEGTTKLTQRAGEGSLRNGLRATLYDMLGLTTIVRNDALVITTVTAAETVTPTRIYQVHDLVVAPNKPEAWPEFDHLTDLITSILAPETWRDAGGTQGEIKPFEGAGVMALVVTHTEEIHDQIEQLLESLRAAKLPGVAELQSRRQEPRPAPPIAPVFYNPMAVGQANGGQPAGTPPANPQPSGTSPADAAPAGTAPSETPKKGGNFFRLHDERLPERSGSRSGR